MRVATVVRDPPGVHERNAAIDRRDRCLRQCRRSRHEVDVGNAPGSANGDVEQRGCNAAGEQSALEGTRSTLRMVRRVENHLVEDGLHRQSSRRKNELFSWIQIGIDARVDRWPPFVQSEARATANDVCRSDVSAFVRQNARRESSGEQLPPMITPRCHDAQSGVPRRLCSGGGKGDRYEQADQRRPLSGGAPVIARSNMADRPRTL